MSRKKTQPRRCGQHGGALPALLIPGAIMAGKAIASGALAGGAKYAVGKLLSKTKKKKKRQKRRTC